MLLDCDLLELLKSRHESLWRQKPVGKRLSIHLPAIVVLSQSRPDLLCCVGQEVRERTDLRHEHRSSIYPEVRNHIYELVVYEAETIDIGYAGFRKTCRLR
jgi:hypothetical protein